MTDKISRDLRSQVMAKVRSVDTKPELLVRSLLHKMGFRFRLHRRDLPGRPDMCLPKHRVAIFVHGCFWHGHTCHHGSRRPATNQEYWNKKLDGNIRRDAAALKELRELGWKPLVIWECQTHESNFSDELLGRIRQSISEP
jgi:DNA mismatch endonuclease (patch repair protein)